MKSETFLAVPAETATALPDKAAPSDNIQAWRGLSDTDAASRLQTDGYNELPSAKSRNLIAIALELIREPMFLLLAACALLYLALGDRDEALLMLGTVFVVMGITFYQERRTERTLETLRDLSSPRALVIRGGVQKRVPGREVVPGDLLVIVEGDRVPADSLLLFGRNVTVDESLLTGESAPVRKAPGAEKEGEERGRPGGDDRPFLYSGTLVVRGHGLARVQATGIHTEIGRIGKSLQVVEPAATSLQRSTRRLVRSIGAIGLFLCVLVVLAYTWAGAGWLKGLLAGLTLAMAMIPEEFPVVLTVFLALGAWRIARNNVLTRRIPAVETLGAVTTLCVDKTGTLTQNRMEVARLCIDDTVLDLSGADLPQAPEAFVELIRCSVLASQPDPFDPMERALHQLQERLSAQEAVPPTDWTLTREYGLSPQLLAMSHVWAQPGHRHATVVAKGAPEAVARLCRFDQSEREALTRRIEPLTEQGLRVLAVAKCLHTGPLPEGQEEFPFTFVGLIGLADPVRPTVAAAVQECYQAGIRLIMITGDYPGTAQSVARQIGMRSWEAVLSGEELARMSAETLQQRIRSVNIFARIMPEQKLLLVNALKEQGEIVAMTGDGVNDAPALKAAHIGIAMGKRGTDVAREAADIVLLEDDFSLIVQAIRMGRRIYKNIKNAMAYIVSLHIPVAGLSLLPILFRWPQILMPVHIVFMELISDPTSSIVFEAEPGEQESMRRPPHAPDEPLFPRSVLLLSLLQGTVVLAVVLIVFRSALLAGNGEAAARALAYTTLIGAYLGLTLTNLSWKRSLAENLRNPTVALRWVLCGILVSLCLVLFVPFLRSLFHFAPLPPGTLLLCFGIGMLSIVWFEILKMIRNSRYKAQSTV